MRQVSADTVGTHRAVAWVKDDPFGVEFAEIGITSTRLTAAGVAIGTAPLHYRLGYELETSADFVTARLRDTALASRQSTSQDLRPTQQLVLVKTFVVQSLVRQLQLQLRHLLLLLWLL